jgi:predicted component of type VI protein secretion system
MENRMQYLLERLADPPQLRRGAGYEGSGDFDIRGAVQAQVRRIAANRPWDKNHSSALLSFGMSSVVDLSGSSDTQLRDYARRLALAIARFEPRLARVTVDLVPAANPEMAPRLQINALLLCPDGAQPFQFVLNDAS